MSVYVRSVGSAASSRFNYHDDFARALRRRTSCASRCVCVCMCLSKCVYVRGVGSAASSRFNDYNDFACVQRRRTVCTSRCVCLSMCVYMRGVGSAVSSRFNYDDFARAQREDIVRIKVRVCVRVLE